MKFFFLNLKFLMKIIPPTRHIKYKKRDFVPCNKSIMANKLRSTNWERFYRTGLNLRLRVNSENYIAR